MSIALFLLENRQSRAEKHRCDVQRDFVDQPGLQELARNAGPTHDHDIFGAGNGSRLFQMRFTFLGNPQTTLVPSLSSLGVAYQR